MTLVGLDKESKFIFLRVEESYRIKDLEQGNNMI